MAVAANAECLAVDFLKSVKGVEKQRYGFWLSLSRVIRLFHCYPPLKTGYRPRHYITSFTPFFNNQ